MPLSLELTGFDKSNPIPGVYAELRVAQGESAGDLGPKKILVVGGKSSAGTITAGTQVVGPISDEADAETYFGAGSSGHRMFRRYLKLHKGAEVYGIAYATASGSAAVDKLVVTVTTITGGGVVDVIIAGETCSAGFTTSSTATTIGDDLANAINAKTWLPVTASNSSGTVTITAKAAGTVYNSIRLRAKYTTGKGVSTNLADDIPIGTSGESGAAIGAGAASYTAIASTILGTKYHYVIVDTQESGVIDTVLDQINLQAEPTTGFRQKLVVGAALSPSAAATLASGATMNAARARLVNQEASPEEHYVTAATCGAVFAKHELSDPSYNFDGYGTKEGQVFPLARPYADANIPTSTELKSMLNQGVTPIGVADNGATYIVRSVTTRCKNGSNFDYRCRDSICVTVGDAFTDDLVARLSAAPWTKVTADPAAGANEPPAAFATPKRVKAVVEQLVSDYADAGYLDPAEKQAMLDSIQVGIDPSVPTRINIVAPIYSAKLLHQMAALVKESSPSA
jgi:phage tail sheath gpL-like